MLIDSREPISKIEHSIGWKKNIAELIKTTKKFREKGILKNYTTLTGKHLCGAAFLIKLQASIFKNTF